MQPGIVLLPLIILGTSIALAIWLTKRANSAKQEIEELSLRLGQLEAIVARLKRDTESSKHVEPVPESPAPPKIFAPAPPALPQSVFVPPPRPPAARLLPTFTSPPPPEPESPSPIRTKPPINWEQFMGVKGFAWGGGLA